MYTINKNSCMFALEIKTKNMKNINDYKGTKTAIHCKTQEEWDKIRNMVGDETSKRHCDDYSCICVDTEICSIDYASENGYTIIHASDFMPTPRTIEQIETELEVLRAELTILKAEAKKKPIEFVKYMSNYKPVLLTPDWEPKDFVSFRKIETNDAFLYDIIEATDSDGLTLVYLGHFNDGVVE